MDDRTIQDGLEAVLKDMGAGAVTVKLDRPKDPKHEILQPMWLSHWLQSLGEIPRILQQTLFLD